MLKKLRKRVTIIITIFIIALIVTGYVSTYIVIDISATNSSYETLRTVANMGGFSADMLMRINPQQYENSPDYSENYGYEGNISELSETVSFIYDKNGRVKEVISVKNTDSLFPDGDYEKIEELIAGEYEYGKTKFDDISYSYFNKTTRDGGIFVMESLESTDYVEGYVLFSFLIVLFPTAIFAYFAAKIIASIIVKPVAEAWEQQKRFISDASHELKTPLTVISANLDVICADESATVGGIKKWLNYIKSETERMRKLTLDLLYLAKIDSGEKKEGENTQKDSAFSVSDLIFDICLTFEPVVFENGKQLTYNVTPDINTVGNPDEIRQISEILLDNAIKNSDPETEITFSLKNEKNSFIIECSDKGVYIPPSDIEKIFDRFYRADTSRARETGGNGLGLAIAMEIIKKRKGDISVKSEQNGLTVFTVFMPVK